MELMEMVEWEVSPKKRRSCSVEHYARFQTAYVLLQTEYKMRLGLIIPHKTKVAIALWRRNTKEFEAIRA
nr:MAG TPA_asm: hypothetical protein [Caudoviricetes sp.]